MTERPTRRTWIWIVVAVAIALALLLLGFAGMSVYLVMRDMQVTQATPASAERELADARARLGDQVPLIHLQGREPRLAESDIERRAARYTGPPPEQLRVMAFDPKENKLVRLSIPMWLVRLRGAGAFPVELGLDTRRVTLDLGQLDRIGPALLVDEEIEGARVLIWTE